MPLRLEIGPKDIEKAQVLSARRDTREKASMPMDGLAERDRRAARRDPGGAARSARGRSARSTRRASTRTTSSRASMEGRPGFVIAGWCGSAECEAQIKAETQATLRNIPFGGADVKGTCVKCGQPSPAKPGSPRPTEDQSQPARGAGNPGLRADHARLPVGARSAICLRRPARRSCSTRTSSAHGTLPADLTTLSYAIDRALWGFSSFGFHLTNVILHIVVVALFYGTCTRALADADRGS